MGAYGGELKDASSIQALRNRDKHHIPEKLSWVAIRGQSEDNHRAFPS